MCWACASRSRAPACCPRRSNSAASTAARCCTGCRWANSMRSATVRRTSRSTAATCTWRCSGRCTPLDAQAIVLNARVTALDESADGVALRVDGAPDVHAELVIGADGIRVGRAARDHRRRRAGVHRPGGLALHRADGAHRARAAHRPRVHRLVRAEEPRRHLLPARRRPAQLRRLRRAAVGRRVAGPRAGPGPSSTTTTAAGTRWCAR